MEKIKKPQKKDTPSLREEVRLRVSDALRKDRVDTRSDAADSPVADAADSPVESRDYTKGSLVKQAKQSTEPKFLAVCAHEMDWEVHLAVANNEATWTETLKELTGSENEQVCRAAYETLEKRGITEVTPEDREVSGRVAEVKRSDSPEFLAEGARSDHWEVRLAVTRNKETLTETLKDLTEDADERVRDAAYEALEKRDVGCIAAKGPLFDMFIANHPATKPEVLAGYAWSGNEFVLRAALRNDVSDEILVERTDDMNAYTCDVALESLRKKTEAPVTPEDDGHRHPVRGDIDARLAVAESVWTPLEELHALADDENEKIRLALAYNIMTPPKTLIALANDKSERVCIALALRADTPPEALAILAKHGSIDVLHGVLNNRNTSVDTLMALAEVKDNRIGPFARRKVDMSFSVNPDRYGRPGIPGNPDRPLN